LGARAQVQPTLAGSPASAPSAAKTDPRGKKVLGLADIARWKRINNAALSSDGSWMTFVYAPNEGDDTLFVKQLSAGKTYTIPLGAEPQFSDDAHYVGYFVSPSEGRGGRGGRGGGGGGGRGAQPGAPASPAQARRFELLDLMTGDKYQVPNGASFKFSKGSKYLAVKATKANAAAKNNGTDLVLRDIAAGLSQNIGNVGAFDFDDSGRLLAYTIDAAERIGNGVYVVDLATGRSRVLNSAVADYDQLSWSDKGTALAALRGDKKKENVQRDNALLVWADASSPSARAVEYDPSKDAGFPKTMVLSELSPLRWTRDGSRIYVGLKEQEAERPTTTEPQANVDVWHWKDTEVQSVQMIRLTQERRATLPAVFHVASSKLVRVSDDVMRNVTPTADPRWAIGRVDTTYRTEVQWGGSKSDYYRVSTETGDRALIDKGLTRTMGSSPDGKWFLYLKEKKLFAYNTESGKSTQLAGGEKISFIDATDDHPYELPVYGVAGWSRDGKSVILNHRFDVYSVPLDGGKATNLTAGIGDAQQIQFRIVRLDRPGGGGRGGRGGGASALRASPTKA
jgi:hypothetical protein